MTPQAFSNKTNKQVGKTSLTGVGTAFLRSIWYPQSDIVEKVSSGIFLFVVDRCWRFFRCGYKSATESCFTARQQFFLLQELHLVKWDYVKKQMWDFKLDCLQDFFFNSPSRVFLFIYFFYFIFTEFNLPPLFRSDLDVTFMQSKPKLHRNKILSDVKLVRHQWGTI